ncbi:AraC family transcriptional regulator [Pseudomonas tructae]|uniref:AraC family transcriptional regulator n=1 Tax=Pseudomonas tructae TaxID=2518644 RepID=A0A411MHK7_9PSED|nr:helix-turn-helix transcriptional regulator [Pseudomonas tructae]QBF26287.1 AraC family transcriptional regulator [Pseudomonas tructae]
MSDNYRRPSDNQNVLFKSRNPEDYQFVAQPVTVMPSHYSDGSYVVPHSHFRGQLLYAEEGVMRAATDGGIWLLPAKRALWIPAGIIHDQTMLGTVKARSLYIDPTIAQSLGSRCRVIEVSNLLKALILALVDEPIEYSLEGRCQHIVALILEEISLSKSAPLEIPWPKDKRLIAVCEAIFKCPQRSLTIEYWADQVGTSPRTLMRLFARETGLNFRYWVQQVKLVEALGRLEQGEPLAMVANALGYASPSAFTAMFRKALGESPREYLAPRRTA